MNDNNEKTATAFLNGEIDNILFENGSTIQAQYTYDWLSKDSLIIDIVSYHDSLAWISSEHYIFFNKRKGKFEADSIRNYQYSWDTCYYTLIFNFDENGYSALKYGSRPDRENRDSVIYINDYDVNVNIIKRLEIYNNRDTISNEYIYKPLSEVLQTNVPVSKKYGSYLDKLKPNSKCCYAANRQRILLSRRGRNMLYRY